MINTILSALSSLLPALTDMAVVGLLLVLLVTTGVILVGHLNEIHESLFVLVVSP